MKIVNKICRTEFFLFGCAGTLGFIVDYLTILLCVQGLLLSPYIARFFSFIAAVLTTYLINIAFTFSTRIKEGGNVPGLLSYVSTMSFGICINYATYAFVLFLNLPIPLNFSLLLAMGMGSLTGLIFNYFLCRTVLFRRQHDPGIRGYFNKKSSTYE